MHQDDLGRNLDTIDLFIKGVSGKYSIPYEHVLSLLSKKSAQDTQIPSYIFKDSSIGILEAVSKYLKEEKAMTYHEIAAALNRDDRVIWVSYKKASKKKKSRFIESSPSCSIPISVFSQNLAPLEAISKYLIGSQKMSFKQAAKLLGRSARSVWASYRRATK